ncbi:probable peroxygenase 5 isoform X2 [Phoenix dactylifera]|uniref:Probable peroxygenase 5 isoform X2 n=1 Tax=Phoenix dactylifera TaxID=42345 RepID=A0A8B9AG44_PHODC|nr:probable peroxygenase 5 isoform X2 [Phoenix dactylifera]
MTKLSCASYLLLLLLIVFPGGVKGQWDNNKTNLTALQKHVSFFDRDKDGVIYLEETYQGFRALGFGVAVSSAASVVINGFLSPITNNGSIPAIFLPVLVANIQKGIHGSDTGAYDTEGRFDSEMFEEIFQKHAHTNPNALTSDELNEMLKANQQPNDFQGRVASRSEWEALFSLAKDDNGLLQKDILRSFYDGSLFYKLEGKRKSLK